MARLRRIEKDYNKTNIFDTLDNLKLSREHNNIITHFDDRLIANTTVTDKYELFDFPPFAKEVISEIENYFTPEKYELRITKGQQELRLIGEDILINEHRYRKMFSILNSTDKSRALQINVGLMRYISSIYVNGVIIGDEYSGLRTKHFKATMPERVKNFVEILKDFDIIINTQKEVLETLAGKTISFKTIATKVALDEHGVMNDSRSLKLRAFAKKLLSSQTEKLEGLTVDQTNLLRNPHFFMNPEYTNVDIEISALKALNCWTEVYKTYDSSVIRRETKRIIDLFDVEVVTSVYFEDTDTTEQEIENKIFENQKIIN